MIWFRHLKTDWFIRRKPVLNQIPFTLAAPDHGRMIVTAANTLAQLQGVDAGMAVADARAVIPSLVVLDDKPGLEEKLLKGLAEWCIRFTPAVAVDEAVAVARANPIFKDIPTKIEVHPMMAVGGD